MRTLILLPLILVAACVPKMQTVVETRPDGTVVETPVALLIERERIAAQRECMQFARAPSTSEGEVAFAMAMALGKGPCAADGSNYADIEVARLRSSDVRWQIGADVAGTAVMWYGIGRVAKYAFQDRGGGDTYNANVGNHAGGEPLPGQVQALGGEGENASAATAGTSYGDISINQGSGALASGQSTLQSGAFDGSVLGNSRTPITNPTADSQSFDGTGQTEKSTFSPF